MSSYLKISNDSNIFLICPRCDTTITNNKPPRTLDCGHIACTDCAHVKKERRLKNASAQCADCNQSTRRPHDYYPPINQALLKIANSLNERADLSHKGKLECSECEGFFDEKEIRLCRSTECSNFLKYLCLSCFVRYHDRHLSAKVNDDLHAAIRDNHKRVDHSSFSDRRVLLAMGQQLVVSATYLASNSQFFANLFYGSPEALATSEFTLNVDPATLTELIDMVYPSNSSDLPYSGSERCEKSCCDNCMRVLPARLKLALELQLTTVVERINRAMKIEKRVELYAGLDNDFTLLKKYVLPDIDYMGELERGLKGDRNKIEQLRPFVKNNRGQTKTKSIPIVYRMSADLPDSRIVHVGYSSFVVSASVLCIFAPWFVDFFYSEENKFKEEFNLSMCDEETFGEFIEVISGKNGETSSKLSKLLEEVGAITLMKK